MLKKLRSDNVRGRYFATELKCFEEQAIALISNCAASCLKLIWDDSHNSDGSGLETTKKMPCLLGG